MKTITALEAQNRIVEFIKSFIKMTSSGPGKFTAGIQNVDFIEFINLYHHIKTDKKAIYMPGELETETMTLIYIPAPDCIITIESEPCVKVWRGSVDKMIKEAVLN